MTDDPRQILKAAGVEVPEVEAWERLANTKLMTKRKMASVPATGDAAILALARLVAKLAKEDRIHVVDDPDAGDCEFCTK